MPTDHFTALELECRDGCGGLPPQAFQDRLEAFRVAWGRPLLISSAARCPEHNARVSTTGRNGPHTIGAVDLLVHGEEAWQLLKAALEWGWSGIGVHQKGPIGGRFIHLDDVVSPHHPRARIWTY